MNSFIRGLLGIILFLLLWQVVAMVLNKQIIVPAPLVTFEVLMGLLFEKRIIIAALHTAWKVGLALVLVLITGILLGLLLGLVEALYEMSRPIIMVIQAVPVISWLSLVLFTWGPSWQGPVTIAFLSLLPLAILTTVSGVRNLDHNLLEMARVYQVPRRMVFRDIYIGSLLPFIVAIIDVSIGTVWKVILVAEYLCGNSGLGERISGARYAVDVPGVWALTIIAVILGLVTERLIKLSLRRLSTKWI
jgi:NitT/TauT family transport system permease protein